jgi:hypothetical protein
MKAGEFEYVSFDGGAKVFRTIQSDSYFSWPLAFYLSQLIHRPPKSEL